MQITQKHLDQAIPAKPLKVKHKRKFTLDK